MVPGAGIEPARRLRRGIFIPATAFAAAVPETGICGLDFLLAISDIFNAFGTQAGAVKSLHFPRPCCHFEGNEKSRFLARRSLPLVEVTAISPGLSSGLPPPRRAEVFPNLTPFTTGVSSLCAQFTQVPCVYQFHHPGI